MQAGIESLIFALKRLARLSTVPDVVILNMGIWVRDWTASGQDYKERFETILQHGNYFLNATSEPPVSGFSLLQPWDLQEHVAAGVSMLECRQEIVRAHVGLQQDCLIREERCGLQIRQHLWQGLMRLGLQVVRRRGYFGKQPQILLAMWWRRSRGMQSTKAP